MSERKGGGYVVGLAAQGIARLQEEPERLREEAARVEKTIASLSLDNYRVFIEGHGCVAHIREQSARIEATLGALLGDLDALRGASGAFRTQAGGIVAAHRRNHDTLQLHMQLLELLEVPQLMDACVRNNLYEEALEIAAFANTLQRRHLAPAADGGAAAAARWRRWSVFANAAISSASS